MSTGAKQGVDSQPLICGAMKQVISGYRDPSRLYGTGIHSLAV
jgi:hypothetical protein